MISPNSHKVIKLVNFVSRKFIDDGRFAFDTQLGLALTLVFLGLVSFFDFCLFQNQIFKRILQLFQIV